MSFSFKLSSTNNLKESDYKNLVKKNKINLLSFMNMPENWERLSKKDKTNEAARCISYAMNNYLERFPAQNTYKQKIYRIFCEWLDRICEKYDISEDLKKNIIPPIVEESGIAFLKAFHREDPISKEELMRKVGASDKTIQTWLRRIDPSLSEDGKAKEGEYRIGGHLVRGEIKLEKDENNHGRRYYHMPSTLHPLMMQMNMMQLGVLLKALSVHYYEVSSVSLGIALDIWSQLSEYAQGRIAQIFGETDKEFNEFIEILKDELSRNDEIQIFKTEEDIVREKDTKPSDEVHLAFKNGKACDISLEENGKTVILKDKQIKHNENGFIAVPANAPYNREDEISIDIDKVNWIDIKW